MRARMMKKRFFNMIEVCLALGVMAVGVIGAVAILPSAMKTSQIASNDVYLADAVNIIFAQIDREVNRIQYEYDESRQKDIANGGTGEGDESLKDDFKRLFESGSAQGETNVCNGDIWLSSSIFPNGMIFRSDVDGANTDGSEVQMFFKKNAGSSFGMISLYHVPENGSVNDPDLKEGVYKSGAKQGELKQSGLQPFFRAVVRIFSTPVNYDPSNSSDSDKSDTIRRIVRGAAEWEAVDYEIDGKPKKGLFKLDTTKTEAIDMNDRKDYWRRVYVEFSYPANVPLGRRTRKTFVKEYYLMD